jgi:hypothetical protein
VFHDEDGSVGGVPNSFILINNGIAVDEACEIKPSWNAAVCKGDIGRLDVAGAPINAAPRLPGAGGGAPAGPGAAAGPGGAAGAGGPPRPAGGFGGGGAGAPPQPPVVLSRNGKESTGTSSNIRAGTEINVTTQRPTVFLNVAELDKGSWVILELPGFNTAASGTSQDSLDALRKASDTSYYKGKDSLWVKVVSAGDSGRAGPSAGGTSVQVSR